MGDVTLLGYQKAFPIFVLSGWCSGSGLAGIVGTLSYIGLKVAGVPNYFTFLSFTILIPFSYYAIFRNINNRKNLFLMKSTF